LANPANLDISEIDAASNNGVDEMRDLREKVQYPPVAGKYKVYIIDEVHMLTQSAFNAVLKTLEEPPRHAVFILATTEPQKIPATILSRCMRFDFKLIPQEDLEGLIKTVLQKTGKEYEDEAVTAIVRAGAGSARDCLSIADMCASYSTGKLTYDDVNVVLGSADFNAVCDIVKSIMSEDEAGCLEKTENVLATGKGVGVLVKDLLTFLNNCAIVKICRNAEQILNIPDDRFKAISDVAAIADGHKILRVTEILAKAESDMRYALNGRITLETALIKCSMPSTDYNIDALIGRVALLEKKLEEGVKVQVAAMPAKTQVEAPAQKAYTDVSAKAQTDVFAKTQPDMFAKAQAGVGTKTYADNVPKKEAEEAARVESVSKPKATKIAEMDDNSPFASPFNGGESNVKSGWGREDVKSEKQGADVQPTIFEQPNAATPPTSGTLTEAEKGTIFGKFLRSFRTTRKNAVLFTLCMDLESCFEGDKFVLITPTEAVYKALTREENNKFIAETLATLGVFAHEVRLKTQGEDKLQSAINKLKDNFKGTDIEIK
jgi:DNA polymerase-3 subunit gamma/tau